MKTNQNLRFRLCVCSLFSVCFLLCGLNFLYAQGKTNVKKSNLQVISIEQTIPGNIFYENEQKEFIIHTTTDSVEWTCSDYWNQVAASGKVAVNAGTASFAVSPNRLGWFKLVVQAKQNGSSVASQETSFAIISDFDLSTVAESPFIAQTHAWQSVEILIPIAKRMGVKYVRDAIRWDAIENPKQVYNFSVAQDRFISLLALNNLKPYLSLALYHPLYDNGLAPVSVEARTAFANYAKQLLSRYPSIQQVEVWNEPDIGTFSKGLTTEAQKTTFYFNLLKTTYEQVHPLFPSVKITGFVVSDLAKDSFLNLIYQKGALGYMNEYAFHSYVSVPESIVTDINRHKGIMKAHNQNMTIPMNLSETGFTTFTFTETEQANYLPRRIVNVLANGISKVGVYNLQNKSIINDSEGKFGLIRHPDDPLGAYTPKPAYATYAALTRQLTGAIFETEEQVSPGLIYSFRFKKGTEEIRVMYSLSGTGVHLYTDSNVIHVVDLMGNQQSYTPVNGVVSLILSKDPVYVKGNLRAPYLEENILNPDHPVCLNYGFYIGGYTEFPQSQEGSPLPDSLAAVKWIASTGVLGPDGKRSRVVAKPLPGAKAVWKAAIAISASYKISAYLPADSVSKANSTRSARYSIYAGGVKVATKTVDQFTNQGKWFDLGTYNFSRGDNNYIELDDVSAAHDKPLRADVLKLDLIY